MLNYNLDDLLRMMPDLEASDLHLRVGEPPMMRIHGDLQRLTQYPVLEHEDTIELMCAHMTPAQQERFESFKELDMAYEVEGVARFRVNCFHQQRHVGAVMRMIPIKIKSIEELGLPQILKEFADLPRGLVLVTGPTGSGKSTTLAAMVNHINDSRKAHIITIEDPIEFVHEDRKCIVEQREVGQDTHAFADALKHVMRQTPDVILVGEMRDLETISLAITAAETGHLVFATLHTNDASQALDRIVDVFPAERRDQIQIMLAGTLQGVVSQRLLPAEGGGRIAAYEVLMANEAVKNLLREGKTRQLRNTMISGQQDGMQTMEMDLARLVSSGIISFETAAEVSQYPKEIMAQAATIRSQMQAQATLEAGQSATTGAGTYINA